MTLYKSMLTEACDRIGPQKRLAPGHSSLLHGTVGDAHGHLFAPFRHASVSWYARHLEKSPPSRAVLVGVHASPVSSGSSPNCESPCNKINGLCGATQLVATNTGQQNQIVTASEGNSRFNTGEEERIKYSVQVLRAGWGNGNRQSGML